MPNYSDGYSPFVAAAAIAGTLNDPETSRAQKMTILIGMRDTIVIAATALALHASTEDKENNPTFPDFEEGRTPAGILEELVSEWHSQVGDELWEEQIDEFLEMEGNHLSEKFSEEMKDLPTIEDSERNTTIKEDDSVPPEAA